MACLAPRQVKDKQFSSALGACFLHHHTPLTVFSSKDDAEWEEELRKAYKGDWKTLLRDLKTLRNQLRTEMQRDADAATVCAWNKIDDTRPSKALDQVSYRYPFTDTKYPDGVAPAAERPVPHRRLPARGLFALWHGLDRQQRHDQPDPASLSAAGLGPAP